jgi:predicted enzyme related to lactoylglutathione lyase
MFKNPDMIILHVNNMDKSLAFYRDILQLKLVDDKPDWKTLSFDNIKLGLKPWQPELADERQVKHGFAFGFYVDDVDGVMKQLIAKGASIHIRPEDRDYGRYAEIVDPDGYIIAVLQYQ